MNYLKTFLPLLFGQEKGKSFSLPADLDWSKLNFEEKLMFHTLGHTLPTFIRELDGKTLSTQQVFHLFSFHEYLPIEFFSELRNSHRKEWDLFKASLNPELLGTKDLQELLNFNPGKLSIIALLHHDRYRPGKILIRKNDGKFHTTQEGHLWSVPVLGLSSRDLAFNHSNGNTPQGVFSIDAVMPEANHPYEFGVHRRLIVNFLPEFHQYLPANHTEQDWWKQSIVARELGRSLLRIHGTGRKNTNPMSSHFPLVPTSGCLATTEVNFMGIYQQFDQRKLLDTLMEASGLQITFLNESKIHGLLYVVEFDGRFQALEFRH